MKCHLPLLCVIFIFVQIVNGQIWKNITPLKSNRTDVEKILGLPTDKDKYGRYELTYSVPEGRIDVTYAPERCGGEIRGWNVGRDTVLTFTLFPSDGRMIDYRKFNEQGLIQVITDTLVKYYIDPEKGVTHVFTYEELARITVTPKVSDNHLRCKSFPPYNTAGASYIPSETFRETDFESAKDNIDSIILRLPKDRKAYVIAYSGSNLSGKNYENYLQQIKRYIRSRKQIDQSRLFVIDGGRRKLFEVELYGLPENYPVPMPQPDL
jgi:hypothetical protein